MVVIFVVPIAIINIIIIGAIVGSMVRTNLIIIIMILWVDSKQVHQINQ